MLGLELWVCLMDILSLWHKMNLISSVGFVGEPKKKLLRNLSISHPYKTKPKWHNQFGQNDSLKKKWMDVGFECTLVVGNIVASP